MSIAKLKAMTETLRKMEEMQKEVNEDVSKDINKKRKAALKKIREYLDDVADSLDGIEININLPNGTVFGAFDSGQSISFNYKYPINRSTSKGIAWSEEPCKWYISHYHSVKHSDVEYYDFIDSTNEIETNRNPGKWANGFINLIEKWSEIKPLIESGIEEYLTKEMQRVREQTTEKVTSYKKVDEFEV